MKGIALRICAAACLLLAAAAASPSEAPALQPLELLAQAGRQLGKTVTLDIVEPLRGPSTPEALARAEYGKVEVEIPESRAGSLALVPANFHLNDEERYRGKFDRVLESPIRVRGELLKDEEMSENTKRPVYVFRVAAVEPLTLDPPVKVASLAELTASAAKLDRKLIEYEGSYRHGFEISALDKDIWLSTHERTAMVAKPSGGSAIAGRRVRVTGILLARPGARYGHLGGYKYMLVASRVEYLLTP